MTRKEVERLTRQADTLRALGFTTDEAESLRRISMTLHRWHERECGLDNGCIERGYRLARNMEKPLSDKNPNFAHDDKAPPYWYNSVTGKRHRIPDRETGARKRLAAILTDRNERQPTDNRNPYPEYLRTYIQGDPRGAALYILRPGDVPEDASADSYYSRGICVY